MSLEKCRSSISYKEYRSWVMRIREQDTEVTKLDRQLAIITRKLDEIVNTIWGSKGIKPDELQPLEDYIVKYELVDKVKVDNRTNRKTQSELPKKHKAVLSKSVWLGVSSVR